MAETYRLRPMALTDLDQVRAWRNHPSVRDYMFSRDEISAEQHRNWFEKVMERICMPFLSESEIGKILKGSDVWMDSDEIRRRLTRMQRAKSPPKPRRAKEQSLPREKGQ